MSDLFSKLKSCFTLQVNTEKLKAKYKNSEKECVMNTIFNGLDGFDKGLAIRDCINNIDVFKRLCDGKILFNGDFEICLSEMIFDDEKISREKIRKYFGENVTVEDVEQALRDLLVENENREALWAKRHAENFDSVAEALGEENIPQSLKNFISPNTIIELKEVNGRKYYSVVFSDLDGAELVFNEEGKRISETTITKAFESPEGVGYAESNVFDENEIERLKIKKYDNGLVDKEDLQTGKKTLEFGKTEFEYEYKGELIDKNNEHIPDINKKVFKDIIVNKGLLNETKLNCEFD